jgi:tetratricopeptide (TPR) repeat protein
MKKIGIALAVLCFVACSSHAQLVSNKMMKIVVRDTSPDTPSTSFGAKPKTLYRMGEIYGRNEELPDLENGIHGLLVIAEPKLWMINLLDKTGKLIIDPGPTFAFRAPIIPSQGKNQKPVLQDFELGREYDFLHQHKAKQGQRVLNGKKYDMLSLSIEGYDIIMFSQEGKQEPFRVIVSRGQSLVCQYDYDEYKTGLAPQMDLFEPGKDIRITAVPSATKNSSSSAYDTALDLLKKGKQDQAEETLDAAVRQDDQNQRLVFFMGVCARSRWMKKEAWPIFAYTAKLHPGTPEGRCAALMLAIDTEKEYTNSFAALEGVHKKYPQDPLILWTTAIACRELGRRGAPRIYSEKGAEYYSELLKMMDPGPVLLHQTCANILSEELGRHEEALKHREIAVRLEPAPWSYQGMANTLTRLKRYDEADINYKKSVEMSDNNPGYIGSWAWSMCERNDYQKAFRLYKQIADLTPDDPDAWNKLGWCAGMLNRPEESQRYYNNAKALQQAPRQR